MTEKKNGIFAKAAGIPRYKIGFYSFIGIASAGIVVLTLVL